ncbi:MAG TPA: polysaccharide biosynthesis C-terminal domain-containing protein [Pyrinomonadaceae bacterium]|nr:polysaccharide biosynthesis C-terminal domain-containing protein [Pyrinomonadaceae bacterium]
MAATSETAATTLLDDEPVFGSFVSGVVLTFGTRLLMLAGVFGSGIVIARWLGPDGFGAYAVVNVTVALALQIGSAGLPSANTYFIARDRNTVGQIWANAIVFALLIGSLLAAGVLALAWLRPSMFGGVGTRLLAIAAVSIPFQLLFVLNLNVLLAMDRIRQLNLFDALLPALVLVNAVIALIVLRQQLSFLISLNTAAGSVLSLVLAIFLGRVIAALNPARTMRPDAQLLKAMLAYGFKFYISIMAGAIIFRADLLIVNHFRGAAEAGVYGVASQFSFLLLMLPGVIATLLFPRVAASQDTRGEFAVQVTRHTTVIMLMTCGAAAALSFMLPLIYGARFADATVQLLILLPGIFLVGLESVLVQHFTGTGLPVAIPVFWLVTLGCNIGLNLLLVPKFGARGAAATSTVSYALIFLLVAVYFCAKTGRGPLETFLLRSHEFRTLFTPRRWLSSATKAAQ